MLLGKGLTFVLFSCRLIVRIEFDGKNLLTTVTHTQLAHVQNYCITLKINKSLILCLRMIQSVLYFFENIRCLLFEKLSHLT